MISSVGSLPKSGRSLIEDVPAVLLVGGLGTRLRSVLPGVPKPLAKVGSGSFLELLVRQLFCQGFRRLVMCTGYLASEVERELGDGRDWGVQIQYSQEPHPLGTGGAVKLAARYLEGSSEFLVMNGDSFIEMDFHKFLSAHRKHGGSVTLASRRVEDASRYGHLRVDRDCRVMSFSEKSSGETTGLINAGVYMFKRAVLGSIPDGTASLERDVFPCLLSQGIYSVEQNGIFIDIGTPEDYRRAQELFARLSGELSPTKNSQIPRPRWRLED